MNSDEQERAEILLGCMIWWLVGVIVFVGTVVVLFS